MFSPENYITLMEIWDMLEDASFEWAIRNPTETERQHRKKSEERNPVKDLGSKIESQVRGLEIALRDALRIWPTAFDPSDMLRQIDINLIELGKIELGDVDLPKTAKEFRALIDTLNKTYLEQGVGLQSLVMQSLERAQNIVFWLSRDEDNAERCSLDTANARRLWLFYRFVLSRADEIYLCPPVGEVRRFPLLKFPNALPSEIFPDDSEGQEREAKRLRYALPQIDEDFFVVVPAKTRRKRDFMDEFPEIDSDTLSGTMDLMTGWSLCWKPSLEKPTAQAIVSFAQDYKPKVAGGHGFKLRRLQTMVDSGEIRTKDDALRLLGATHTEHNREFRRLWADLAESRPNVSLGGRRPAKPRQKTAPKS